jgi:hypothetical protein
LLRRRSVRPEPQDVGAVERSGDDNRVHDDLDEAPPVDDEHAQESLPRFGALRLAAVDVARKLANCTISANVRSTPMTVIFASSITV